MTKEQIIERIKANNRALERAAWNMDGSKIDLLPKGIIESTGASTTCLIEVRENNKLIEQLTNDNTRD